MTGLPAQYKFKIPVFADLIHYLGRHILFKYIEYMPPAVYLHKIPLYQPDKIDEGKDHRQQYHRSDYTSGIKYFCQD